MKGSVVMATLNNGSRLEGILDRVDLQERRVLLKMVFVWPEATSAVPQEHAFRDFALSDLVALSAAAVNFAEATGGGGFATDTDITAATGATGRAGGMRELARWEGGEDGEGAGLEDDMPPGSRHWDQFATNQKLFGVVTSFDESAYTTVLDRESAEFKTRHTEAERLAREIERGTGSTSNPHLAEERGAVFDDSQLDEEDRYGAVVRDQRRSPKGAVSYKEAAAAGGGQVVSTWQGDSRSGADAPQHHLLPLPLRSVAIAIGRDWRGAVSPAPAQINRQPGAVRGSGNLCPGHGGSGDEYRRDPAAAEPGGRDGSQPGQRPPGATSAGTI